MDAGNLLGFGIYTNGLLPGFSTGVDIMGTRALYTGFPGEYIETLSVMAVLRKDFPLGQSMDGYVSGGVGAIRNTYADGDVDYRDTVAGAQISVGLRRSIGAGMNVFGEVKHQTGLKDAYFSDLDVEQSYSSTSLLFGFQFGF
jgi:hypothetical protein